jgi:serine/threonine-protein kinase
VPDVVGRPVAAARQVLEAEGLRIGHVVEQWSGEYPDGFVTEQDPAAMSRVKAGREVRLTVSIGSAGQEVPDLTGTDARDAQVRLARGGLRAGRLVLAHSETTDKDAVIASDPPARSRVESGSRVDLLVSLGAKPVTFLLPDLRGRHVDEIGSLLERSGIRLTARTRDARAAAPGEILEQQPPPGYRIRNGELVELVIASGRGGWR